jgi:hypothetical protein
MKRNMKKLKAVENKLDGMLFCPSGTFIESLGTEEFPLVASQLAQEDMRDKYTKVLHTK